MKNKGLSRLFITFWLVSILGAIFLSLPVEAAPAETVTLTMVSQYPLTNLTINYPPRYFKKWVEAWSGGRIKVDFKGGPEIIAPSEIPKVIERGMFDVCYGCPPYTGAQYPAFQLFNFVNPANYRLAVHDDKVWDLMNKIVRNHGMVYLGVWNGPSVMFTWFSKKPPLDGQGRIESLKGLKIRTGGAFDADLITSLGGTAVAMHPGEIYEGIRTKLIDGTMFPVNATIDTRLKEVVSYMSRDPVYNINSLGYLNAKVFDKLSPESQKLIIEVAKEVQDASYNYTLAITWDGLLSNGALATVPTLSFSDSAKQALARARENKLSAFAAAEPNLSHEVIDNFKKYYGAEHLPVGSEALVR